MKKLIITCLILSAFGLNAQHSYDALSAPNTYQNADNPNYWKNKMPHAAYWQQDVYYNIKANIDEETNIVDATQQLTYTNNSPDDLDIVYFHLYQNAFQPDSYLDELQKQNRTTTIYGEFEKQKLGTVIESITINGKEVQTELDNTILKVYMPVSLKSNESVTFYIKFKSYFDDGGNTRRRMDLFNSWGYKHYNGVHWYPRICVYDAKFGWTKDQHLGKEFYGDFGAFDVELTFASHFVVGATGFLTNRDEVLPKELRDKLDITNFKDKPWGEYPSVITEYKRGETKTWKYHAENVHDFGFTADPTYRIGESWWQDKVCYSLVQEPHASKWQNAAEYSAKVIQVFSEDFGRYTYHKMIVADARSGMEYPMMTLDGGQDPGYRGLLVHEIGHNWFFGQVGNNETYRALLDEGFTQFLTAWGLIKIDGDNLVSNPPSSKYKVRFKKPTKAIDSRVFYAYINDATKFNDPVISTHSDGFNGGMGHGGGYRHVYYKTASMLYNLQYVLGDELFLNAMKHYFGTWKIAHPYNEDFRDAIIQYTKVDLNWFFDQWLDTDKRIDYSVDGVKSIGDDKYEITFSRNSRMQMPIDFSIKSKKGMITNYHIPNNWFVKKTDATVLPKWHGWDLMHQTYTATLIIKGGIENVIIDPTNRLADAYMPDNSWKNNITYSFNDHLWKYSDWKNYEVKYQPNLWYNSYDGIKLGLNISGGYMNHHHLFDATVWMNTGVMQDQTLENYSDYDPMSFRLNYNTNLDKISLNTRIIAKSEFLAGLYTNKFTVNKSGSKRHNKITVDFLSLYRTGNGNYLLYPNQWQSNKLNNRIDVNLEHNYKYSYGSGKINLIFENSAIGSDYNYNKIILSAVNKNKAGKLKVNTRTYLQIVSGDNWAEESKLNLAGANNEELMDSKFTRSVGMITRDYTGFGESLNNFHSGGGLNLRGYSGYIAPEFDENGNIISENYNGTSGAAFNTEIDFSSYLPYNLRRKNINAYLFADAGIISSEKISRNNYKDAFTDVRADAGIGFTYTHKNWGPLETINPLVIRLDLPLFLNRPISDEEYLQMRWIVGIGKTF